VAIVAGVDFATLSVRVSLVDSEEGMLESAVCAYPIHRRRGDPGGSMANSTNYWNPAPDFQASMNSSLR
jgi:ribulose kinase